MIYYDILWYIMIYYDILWYIMIYYIYYITYNVRVLYIYIYIYISIISHNENAIHPILHPRHGSQVSCEFRPQCVANSAWSFVTLSRSRGQSQLWDALAQQVEHVFAEGKQDESWESWELEKYEESMRKAIHVKMVKCWQLQWLHSDCVQVRKGITTKSSPGMLQLLHFLMMESIVLSCSRCC